MRNQPYHQQLAESGGATRFASLEPQLRLWGVWLILAIGVVCNLTRLAYIQLVIPHHFDYALDVPVERTEDIPRRTGRILSREGLVLAMDRDIYHLSIHYRWLEDPVNPQWLKEQIRNRLPPKSRKNKAEIAKMEADILRERSQLWQAVSELTSLSPQRLLSSRKNIQLQVEHIANSVRSRQIEPIQNQSTPMTINNWWSSLQSEMLTPPQRHLDPSDFIIKEELAYHRIVDNLPLDKVLFVESHQDQFKGAKIECDQERIYPEGDLAAHLIGYRRHYQENHPNTNDTGSYQPGELLGVSGVERHARELLDGERGQATLTVNKRGELLSQKIKKPLKSGLDVTLSLHAKLQQSCEQLLDQIIPSPDRLKESESELQHQLLKSPTSGCILMMDVRSGEILTAAVAPRPHNGLLAQGDGEYWQLLMRDRRRPLFPRWSHLELPPGSVFKIATSVALLEEGVITPDQTFSCQGYLQRPDRNRCYIFRHFGVGHGEITFHDAISRSCNVFFFNKARQAGPELLLAWYDRLGFGKSTSRLIPHEQTGHLPDPSDRKHYFPGDTLGMAIGQSTVLVTPLQILKLMGMIANGGKHLEPTPYLRGQSPMKETTHIELASYQNANNSVQIISPRTAQEISRAMIETIQSPRGTGHKSVYMKDVLIAGKTGTAETGGETDHAWFAGFVPADKPRIAFVIILEDGGSGGADAGPLTKASVEQLLKLGLIQPRSAREEPLVINQTE